MNDTTLITILGAEESDDRSAFDRIFYRYGVVPTDQLKDQVAKFLAAMKEVVDGTPAMLGDFKLDTITLTAELSAKGQVSLLGTGVELASKGGLTFTLKRLPIESAKETAG